ncbi:HPr family phosphocarrier protein [Qiania dongpingensis]|uniref:HPr family phosphocarrier protein n=1 Tax=Qiania dongpingensis TaxID=2763669 RepID=A0A7G9G627_9FIRM|nr:HPr family phosphocarrier protein [Qiania dongpingensis]QNM06259.1 HPr family phosphocarrier protein [Qiania dongpingensis]
MKSFTYVITDEVGIHARPAGVLAKEAKSLDSKVFLEAGGKKAEATRLLAVMGMGVKKGMEITVTVEGGDEEAAAAKLEAFFKANL